MKAIILGAGELGRSIASILTKNKHDVVMIDLDSSLLERLARRLDVMPIQGDGAAIQVLKEAGVDRCDILIAACGDDAANILACQIGNHFNVDRSICRLTSLNFFSESDGFTAKSLGISNIVIPEDECVRKIANVLDNRIVLERILFSHPDAEMTAISVETESPIRGAALQAFPKPELLAQVRISGIIRDRKLLVPQGDTVIQEGDEIYLAGKKEHVAKMIEWASPKNSDIHRVIIAGASRNGAKLAEQLSAQGKDVRIIEKRSRLAEAFLDSTSTELMVINGDPSENDILLEAGVENCDAFVSVQIDDEDNILCAALARKKGARKTVAFTTKAEYVDVVPEFDLIDCSFSSNTIAVNSVLRHLDIRDGAQSVSAVLHRTDAYLYEFQINAESLACNKRIDECRKHASAIFTLIFRGKDVLAPSGDLVLQEGDVAATIATPKTVGAIHQLFQKR